MRVPNDTCCPKNCRSTSPSEIGSAKLGDRSLADVGVDRSVGSLAEHCVEDAGDDECCREERHGVDEAGREFAVGPPSGSDYDGQLPRSEWGHKARSGRARTRARGGANQREVWAVGLPTLS